MTNKTSLTQLKAVRRYEQKVNKLQIVFNVKDNQKEKSLFEALQTDNVSFGKLAKKLLFEHYNIK